VIECGEPGRNRRVGREPVEEDRAAGGDEVQMPEFCGRRRANESVWGGGGDLGEGAGQPGRVAGELDGGGIGEEFALATGGGLERVGFFYDPATGEVGGPLAVYVKQIGKGYTIVPEELRLERTFELAHPSVRGVGIYDMEGRLIEPPAACAEEQWDEVPRAVDEAGAAESAAAAEPTESEPEESGDR